MTKPATQRPKLPSVGRLGLVDPHACAHLTQLGWTDDDDQAHVDLLWSLSRAPDADAALRTLVRLAEKPDTGWEELNAALLTERSLRGRLFAVLGSSLTLGTIWSRTHSPGSCSVARSRCRLATGCGNRSSRVSRNRRMRRPRWCTGCAPCTGITC
ncbi:hypothetical protein NIIDMKKI_27250 [Mycobacterium kansasii]|uniref:Uncharacterized protein n=1 Tax=Mycobacterium kansasii TaxID=1768 RepID=A0A7G1ID94_MYCKA|nr:hypothetical protein NIIDMKKI_27250 [Mycobacterium kansasii]